jgi:hypothetical protein
VGLFGVNVKGKAAVADMRYHEPPNGAGPARGRQCRVTSRYSFL